MSADDTPNLSDDKGRLLDFLPRMRTAVQSKATTQHQSDECLESAYATLATALLMLADKSIQQAANCGTYLTGLLNRLEENRVHVHFNAVDEQGKVIPLQWLVDAAPLRTVHDGIKEALQILDSRPADWSDRVLDVLSKLKENVER